MIPPCACRKVDDNWVTGMALSPYDGDYYACQYKHSSVIIYHGSSLAFKRVFVCSPDIESPEGIAFGEQSLFVATANCYIVQFNLNGDAINNVCFSLTWVAWGLAYGPDGGLYCAVDKPYRTSCYTKVPPERGQGCILRIQMQGDSPPMVKVFSKVPLTRPSGIKFIDTGSLLTTDMYGKIVQMHGPKAGNLAGTLEASYDMEAQGLPPWDVGCYGNVLVATVHQNIWAKRKGNVCHVMVMDRTCSPPTSRLIQLPDHIDHANALWVE